MVSVRPSVLVEASAEEGVVVAVRLLPGEIIVGLQDGAEILVSLRGDDTVEGVECFGRAGDMLVLSNDRVMLSGVEQ